MTSPISEEALHNALSKEQERQKMDSREVLLDEEGLAFQDLSHQRSPMEPRPVNLPKPPVQSSAYVGQTGWRGGTHEKRARERRNTLIMGRVYEKMGKLSIIPRYAVYIIPMASLIAVPLVIGALMPQLTLGGVRLLWIFMWVEIVWISFWVSKIFAKLLPYLFKFFVGFVSAGTAKYSTIIAALEVPFALLAWSFVSFVTFIPIMTRNPTERASGDTDVRGWEATLRQILAALTVIALVYLIQKTFIQFVAINFHKVSYEQRIQKNKHSVHILARLYEQSRALFPQFSQDFKHDDEVLMGVGGETKLGYRSVSGTATPTMRAVLGGAKKAVNKATSAFGSVAQEVTGKQIFQPTSPYSVVVEALASSSSCTSLARRLWFSFTVEGEEVLHQQDLEEVLGNAEEAREAMQLFDKDGNGDVTLDEAEMVVHEISKERKSLARSMRDVDTAIEKLDNVLVVVVFIIAIFIFISFLNSNFYTTLATAGTVLLSLSFIFSATCQEMFSSILFLFYKHPFDVGDRVNVDGKSYVVKELSLLFTTFKRTDGTQVQVNNAVLNNLWIENVRRSNSMSEVVQLQVDFGTPFSRIQKLRQEMMLFVQANTRDYASDLEIEIMDAKGLDKLLLQVVIKHKSNWQNDALRAHRRNKFMCALVSAVRKAGIVASGPGLGHVKNPMHIVRDLGAESSSSDRPGTSSGIEVDPSFGQKGRAAEDPTTQVEDDRQPQLGLGYDGEDRIGPQLRGNAAVRLDDQGWSTDRDIERGKSFGRRRKQVQNDLEKGV